MDGTGSTARAIRAAATQAEAGFLQAGAALESAVEILARLGGSFDSMLAELKGEAVAGALAGLSQAAGTVTAIGQAGRAGDAALAAVARRCETVGTCIARLDIWLGAMKVLSVNARIAASGISVRSADFASFAGDIARTLGLAQTSLDAFGTELRALRDGVAAARAGQGTFARRREEAVRSVPAQLVATGELIARQHGKAVEASAGAGSRSAQIRAQVCGAIVALQIGDTTRQRLEHADEALGLLDAAALDAREHRVAAKLVMRLVAAQLGDAAGELSRETGAIIAALGGLAGELRALQRLGQATYGAAERGRSRFIEELEAQIGAARSLFEDFATVEGEAAATLGQVAKAAGSLRAHLRKVQSREADLRIMGLNTTFRCARAGQEGRVLSCIAQELRANANEFARESGVLMDEMEAIAREAAGLARVADEAVDGAAPGQAAEARLDAALAALRATDQRIGEAMAGLDLDGDRVAELLEQAMARLAANDGVEDALRTAVAALAPPEVAEPIEPLEPAVQALLERIECRYTMASERRIHARILGHAPEPGPEREPAEMAEDFLF